MITQAQNSRHGPDDVSGDGPVGAEDLSRPALQRHMAMLDRLAEIGMTVCETLGRLAAKADPDAPLPDAPPGYVAVARPVEVDIHQVTLSYARASRAVRLSLALQAQVIEHLRRADRIAASDRDDARRRRKDQVGRVLTRIIDTDETARDDKTYERLVETASERLDEDDRFGDILARPISDIIALICADLDLTPDWPRLAEEAWARDELASGDVGAALKPPSPWMGEGSGMGVAPYPASPRAAEPLPPPIPALSPIQGERRPS